MRLMVFWFYRLLVVVDNIVNKEIILEITKSGLGNVY